MVSRLNLGDNSIFSFFTPVHSAKHAPVVATTASSNVFQQSKTLTLLRNCGVFLFYLFIIGAISSLRYGNGKREKYGKLTVFGFLNNGLNSFNSQEEPKVNFVGNKSVILGMSRV